MALFALISSLPCPCQEKPCMAEVGLTSFLGRSVNIEVSYCFCRHWSVTAEADISYKGLSRVKSSVETEHKGEFGSDSPLLLNTDSHCESFTFNYWPSEVFRGWCISGGIQSGSPSGIDIITEICYTFHIWQGIGLSTGLKIPLLEGLRNPSFNARQIKVGLNYRF